jgi:hypothetical protein
MRRFVRIIFVSTDERENFNEKLCYALLFTSMFNIRVFTELSPLGQNLFLQMGFFWHCFNI